MAKPTWEELSRRQLEAKSHGLPPQITAMLATHGPGAPGLTCGTCAYLYEQHTGEGGRTYYFKCARYKASRGPGTDWRTKWPACGLYQHTPAEWTHPAPQPADRPCPNCGADPADTITVTLRRPGRSSRVVGRTCTHCSSAWPLATPEIPARGEP